MQRRSVCGGSITLLFNAFLRGPLRFAAWLPSDIDETCSIRQLLGVFVLIPFLAAWKGIEAGSNPFGSMSDCPTPGMHVSIPGQPVVLRESHRAFIQLECSQDIAKLVPGLAADDRHPCAFLPADPLGLWLGHAAAEEKLVRDPPEMACTVMRKPPKRKGGGAVHVGRLLQSCPQRKAWV